MLALVPCLTASAQTTPSLPDTTGWGVRVLTDVTAPDGARWVGTYGQGMFVLRPAARAWERIRSDTTTTSISWDFVQAIAFGPTGLVWYGTVGNGWGLSIDGGKTWRNWTLRQLGPEWQYVAPAGIATRGDTTVIATADGLQVTSDDGAHWIAIVDPAGPAARGPADTALVLLDSEYVTALRAVRGGWLVTTPAGETQLAASSTGVWRRAGSWDARNERRMPGPSTLSCSFSPGPALCPALKGPAPAGEAPRSPLTTWFRRPIDPPGNVHIDQTYRYGSTMGGNFQQHQGVEFNNPDGTPVHAIGAGLVVYAGPAEAGALTVGIRHDRLMRQEDDSLHVFSVYYHNSSLNTKVGARVREGDIIARVGNTGRATNDHLHLEVHATLDTAVGAIVDSLNRFPSFTTNPELWIAPLPGSGIVAGVVRNAAGERVKQSRIYGLIKSEPHETPFAFVETYGDRTHPHPLYQEDFAIGDVPKGEYVLGVSVDDIVVRRRIKVEPGKLTWVDFRPEAN